MVFIGCSLRHMTLQHHIEHITGAPYMYMKAYFTPVYKKGRPLKLPFLCCVRYLNGKVEPNDFSKFERHLRRKRMLRKGKIGNAKTLLVSVKDAFNEGYSLLQKDPCYFLEKPFYMTQ
jgi:aminoglycoside N3'-acetyltransferase